MKPRNKYAYTKQSGYGRHKDKRKQTEQLWEHYVTTVDMAMMSTSAKQRRKTWEG
jgi:hypothetical protein